MAGVCVFCGYEGQLSREHVFGDWLNTIGLDRDPVALVTGPLNRLGEVRGPLPRFYTQVRDVCTTCNGGWMRQLERVAARVLTPAIRGEPAVIEASDQGRIAAWLQKTALVSMLVSSEQDRVSGYGLPPAEYRALYEQRELQEPLPGTTVSIGRYRGPDRTPMLRVTPLAIAVEGVAEPTFPQAYAMTMVLGELLLHGVRFTTRLLDLDVTVSGLTMIWPTTDRVIWLDTEPFNTSALELLANGNALTMVEPGVGLIPWKPATELPKSEPVGLLVKLPTLCGKHFVYYPADLVQAAVRRQYVTFMAACECGLAYLIVTEADGAHCKATDTPEAIMALYHGLPGSEDVIHNEHGSFVYKQLPSP